MSTNHTPNYQLSQWERSDKVLMEDFNADNAKIDAALKAETDARTSAAASLASQLAGKGNCQIHISSYKGAGEYGRDKPRSITFSRPPQAAVFLGTGGTPFAVAARGMFGVIPFGYNQYTSLETTWQGNTLSWASTHDPESAFNVKDKVYYVITFLAADQ